MNDEGKKLNGSSQFHVDDSSDNKVIEEIKDNEISNNVTAEESKTSSKVTNEEVLFLKKMMKIPTK